MSSFFVEVCCLAVLILVGVVFQMKNQSEGSNDIRNTFKIILYLACFELIAEGVAAYIADRKDAFSVPVVIGAISVFYLLLMGVIFVAYNHIKKLINQDIPSLMKIRMGADYTVGFTLMAMILLPILCLSINGKQIIFHKYIMTVYFLLACIELFIVILIIRFRKYINPKRKKIFIFGFAVQGIWLIFQLIYPHSFLTCIPITIMVFSFYMALENEDVKLIEQLATEKEHADYANIAKSGFIANISHEIRTPINAVLGMDEMILRETTDLKTRQYALDIKSAAQTLHGIINEILDMSKMESGKMEILPVNYNMRSLINDAVNIIQMKINDKHLSFVVNVDKDIPAGYHGDETRIKQILNNILGNAVKYTEKGTVTMTISGESIGNNKELLHFSVEDTGIGMRKEELDNLFTEYQRFSLEKTRNIEGTGLGMTITMELIKMMGSELKVESVYGEGSTFSFDLVQEIWDETLLGDYRTLTYSRTLPYTYEQSFEAPQTRVLVVDDNMINRKVFVGLLKDTKLLIDEAESGPSCLNMVKKNKYDMIFMDHMMPDMDGIETFHRMREMEDNMSQDAVVIMLTANAVSGAKEMYLGEGFNDFIAKPIVPDKLEEMIKKYLP